MMKNYYKQLKVYECLRNAIVDYYLQIGEERKAKRWKNNLYINFQEMFFNEELCDDYFEVILGLNKKEARIIAKILGAENTEDFAENIEAADYIKAHSRISKVIIHNAHGTCGISKDERAVVDTPYCENPKQTTGAGDNFNAGFLLGQLLEMNLEESLAVGIANSGYYIREAVSADKGAITEFVIKWKDGSLE